MHNRFLSIWFRHLTTDRWVIKRPELKGEPFVLAAPERGRMMVKASSPEATSEGVYTGMVVADARAILPTLKVYTDDPGLEDRLLKALAEWCLRYTPVAATDAPDGLILDITGCPHLWGGEQPYLENITATLKSKGYHVRAAIADTIGAAWATARYGKSGLIVEPGEQREALLPLPPTALRLESGILQRLEKLGFHHIGQFIDIPYQTLRRRFGETLSHRLDQALGTGHEPLQPIQPLPPYREELPCLEPIRTATVIQIAL
jgi:protein ImuB